MVEKAPERETNAKQGSEKKAKQAREKKAKLCRESLLFLIIRFSVLTAVQQQTLSKSVLLTDERTIHFKYMLFYGA